MTVDELRGFGVKDMDETAIRNFLTNERFGVLGLPTGNAPYLVPLSFGYDGESALYFTFVLGADSRKRALSDRADAARFLAYNVSSPFVWESVLLTGTVERVPESEWSELRGILDAAWRPDVLERAGEVVDVAVYQFVIDGKVGLKHAGLPPGFDEEAPENR